MPSLKKLKRQSRIFYNQWRKRKTFCPALNSEVKITLKGWRHISGATGYKKRSICDTYRRLMLLPHAETIITKSTTIQNIITRKGVTYYALEAMINVTEKGRTILKKVRTILVEDKMKNKIFYSVMDKKNKPIKKKKLP